MNFLIYESFWHVLKMKPYLSKKYTFHCQNGLKLMLLKKKKIKKNKEGIFYAHICQTKSRKV